MGLLVVVCSIAALCAIFLSARHRSCGSLGFRIIVVIVSILLITGVVLPMLGQLHHGPSNMKNSTQARGIHQALIIFAQGNNTYFPGRDRDGAFDLNHVFRIGDPQTALYDHPSHPAWRLRRLIEDNHFSGEHIISPSESKPVWESGAVTPDNYSYAMLSIADLDDPRANEWRNTNNYKAPTVTDRIVPTETGGIRSVHTNPIAAGTTEWRGSVAWNDNHVSFEPDFVVDTIYGQQRNADDNLFAPTSGDAYLVYDQP
jgi:hypothetical protein